MQKIFRLIKTHYHKPLLVFALLTLWQLGVMLFQVKEYIIPSPLAVLARIFVPEMAGKYHWLKHIYATFIEIFFGFVITAILGVFLAILIAWSRLLRGMITPLLTFFNSIPKIAMAPLFILWFGYGIVPNILIAFLVSFFPIVINTATGLGEVEEDLLDLVREFFKTDRYRTQGIGYIDKGRMDDTINTVDKIMGVKVTFKYEEAYTGAYLPQPPYKLPDF